MNASEIVSARDILQAEIDILSVDPESRKVLSDALAELPEGRVLSAAAYILALQAEKARVTIQILEGYILPEIAAV